MSQRSTLRTTTLALMAAFALAACSPTPEESSEGGASPQPEGPTAAVAAAPDSSSAPSEPATVPDQLQFTATTLDGETFDGASLYGQPTILWFWASWCPTCQAEAPGIVDALDELPAGVQAIGVPGSSGTGTMQDFVDKYGLGGMIQLVDADGSLWSRFGVAYQPAVAVIDADGNVTTLPSARGKADFLEAAASIAP